jgi:hypothetical protein
MGQIQSGSPSPPKIKKYKRKKVKTKLGSNPKK